MAAARKKTTLWKKTRARVYFYLSKVIFQLVAKFSSIQTFEFILHTAIIISRTVFLGVHKRTGVLRLKGVLVDHKRTATKYLRKSSSAIFWIKKSDETPNRGSMCSTNASGAPISTINFNEKSMKKEFHVEFQDLSPKNSLRSLEMKSWFNFMSLPGCALEIMSSLRRGTV